MSRSQFFANRNMAKRNETSDRPEELLIAEVIEHHVKNCKVLKQKVINYVTEYHEITHAKIDVFVIYSKNGEKPSEYLIRVMGAKHLEKDQKAHDERQKAYLLGLQFQNIRNVAEVIDLWWWRMPYTWKTRDRKLSDDELSQAYAEIRKYLCDYFKFPEKPSKKWLKTSEFKKTVVRQHTTTYNK